MHARSSFISLLLVLFISFNAYPANAGDKITIDYTVSMEKPNTHYFHVVMQVSNYPGDNIELRLPDWTPGYYWIMNYAANISSFKAEAVNGESLQWEKTDKSTWKINKQGLQNLRIEYDVYAYRVSVADAYLDYGRAFISPTAVFMYPAGNTDQPCTVKIIPYSEWKSVCTGLDRVAGSVNTFRADNYDVLYDCPILAGNMKVLHFEVENIPYTLAVENPGNTDLEGFKNNLEKIIPVATGLIGDIPYKHYTFLIMDRGMGGLEHANSMAVYARGNFYEKENKDRNKGWMNFITHEFFHLYNVKRISPAGLWPLDYNSENYTDMLWVSEGFTVYYEYIIMNRAGLLTVDDVLNYLGNTIRSYESIPGSRYQSATESSFDTWISFFNRSSNTQNATISYYDKGCALGMLLDLAIRKETGNEKSLDDVMSLLYFKYYRDLNRGFTGDEFRSECESMAGTSLDEIFDVYASSTGDIDYNKYLGYAGLQIDMEAVPVRGSYLGATTRTSGDETIITSVLRDSPAWNYGLSVDDVILQINGQPPADRSLDEILKHSSPGDTLNFRLKQRYFQRDISVVTDTLKSVSYRIYKLPDPDPMQQLILKDWIK